MSGPVPRDALKQALPAPLGEQVAEQARLVSYRSGQVVIGHQDPSTEVFFVVEGTLRVELHSMNGREIILADVGPGDLVGEFAAIDERPRSATVTTTSKCTLATLPGATFKRLVLSDPVAAEWISKRLVEQVRQMTQRIFELNALAVRSRLHCELLRLSIDGGIADNRAVIAPAPTHAQIANRIGTHREAVTRELQYLHEQGITAQEGRTLTVHDVERLAEIVRAAAGDIDLIQRASSAGIGRASIERAGIGQAGMAREA